MAPLALVANMATRWHHLHELQIWPPDGATCISRKFAHQIALLVLTTRLHYLYCYIALLALSVSNELVSSSARVTSVKSAQHESLTDGQPDPTIGPQVDLGPIKRITLWPNGSLFRSQVPIRGVFNNFQKVWRILIKNQFLFFRLYPIFSDFYTVPEFQTFRLNSSNQHISSINISAV